ncbi:MAG: hypothetical protein NXI04_24520 [Planctomycetaceae bacterium]|nr:hypothetical protein [Planctomycetaceae bacterium]
MMTSPRPAASPSPTSEQLIARPPFADWSHRLRDQSAHRPRIASTLADGRLCQLRSQVLSAAAAYTDELAQLSADVGLGSGSLADSVVGTCDAPIAATGHQPIVFHPGLLAKNQLLQKLLQTAPAASAAPEPSPSLAPAGHQAGSGLMIQIDTDAGAAGTIRFPEAQSKLQVTSRDISTGSDLFLSQRILPEDRVADLAQEVVSSLETFGFADAAERTSVVMDQYTRLAGQSAVAANAIVRRLWQTDATYLELPFSRLCQLSELQAVFREWIYDASRLHRAYNTALQRHRLAHGITNAANPFPDLASTGRSVELPFWVVSADGRQRETLVVNPAEPLSAIGDTDLIVPRGMLISTVLRLFVSDLFIHGTGGEHYDVCTERFVADWLDVDLPESVTATATRYLFADEVRQLEEVSLRRQTVHNSQHRFRTHVEHGRFPLAWQPLAKRLLTERETAVAELNAARAGGRSAMDIHRHLKAVRRKIETLAHAAFAHGSDLRLPSPVETAVLQERRFPFFFFD